MCKQNHYNNISRSSSTQHKPLSAHKPCEETKSIETHEKETENNVRGSPQPRGYVHQKVSHACDIHFIRMLQSATEKLPSFSLEPHRIPLREYFSRIESYKILDRIFYICIIIFFGSNYNSVHEKYIHKVIIPIYSQRLAISILKVATL